MCHVYLNKQQRESMVQAQCRVDANIFEKASRTNEQKQSEKTTDEVVVVNANCTPHIRVSLSAHDLEWIATGSRGMCCVKAINCGFSLLDGFRAPRMLFYLADGQTLINVTVQHSFDQIDVVLTHNPRYT